MMLLTFYATHAISGVTSIAAVRLNIITKICVTCLDHSPGSATCVVVQILTHLCLVHSKTPHVVTVL